MAETDPREKTVAEMLSKAIVEIVDNNAHLMTILDLQARILAQLEHRDPDRVVDEVSTMLRARRREALRTLDTWTMGESTLFEEDAV